MVYFPFEVSYPLPLSSPSWLKTIVVAVLSDISWLADNLARKYGVLDSPNPFAVPLFVKVTPDGKAVSYTHLTLQTIYYV